MTITNYLRTRLYEQAGICPGVEPSEDWLWWSRVDGADVWQPEAPPQHGGEARADPHDVSEPVYVPIDEVDAGDEQPRPRGKRADAMRHYERVRRQLAALLEDPILPVDPYEVGVERSEVIASQLRGAQGSLDRAYQEQAEINRQARIELYQQRAEKQARARKAERHG